EGLLGGLGLAEVDGLEVVLLGHGLEQLLLVDQAAGHGHLAEALRGGLGLVEQLPELVVVDEAEVDEDLAELAPPAVTLGGALADLGGGLLAGGGLADGGLDRSGGGLGARG